MVAASGSDKMDQQQATLEEQLHFHVNLADRWERQYLARRLGVSEETLVATAGSVDPTVEELFDSYCPMPGMHRTHAQLHLESFAA
jgi:hypothetical protein